MIMVDTSKVTLDELDEMVVNMGQHEDQVLAKEHSSSSSAFVSVKSKREMDCKLDNMNKQLESLLKALSSSQSPAGSIYELGNRGRGAGRNTERHGKKKRYCWNCGGDHHVFQRSKTILKAQENNYTHVSFDDELHFCLLTPMSSYLHLLEIQIRYIFRLKCQILMISVM